jgi:hypothetical protein
MKKIIIALVVVLVAIALLPILGNSVAEKVLQERIDIITSNGVELKSEKSETSYLNTQKHYEFLLSDAPKFMAYLDKHSDAQIPPYVEAMMEGVVVGIDIKYSNFPLSTKVIVDIYPLTMPTNISQELKKEDMNFYTYVEKFLQNKGLLYHINYYLSDDVFVGYIKNINEEYSFDNGSKIKFSLKEATYHGEGPIVSPKDLQTNISKIEVQLDDSKQSVVFEMDDLRSASSFESHSTYALSASLNSMLLITKDSRNSNIEMSVDALKLNASSNAQGEKAEFNAKSSLGELKFSSPKVNVVASEFNYNISLDDVDKDAYEEFRKLTSNSKTNYSNGVEKELQESITKLLSKGLSLSVADISVTQLSIENKKPIDGFSMMAKLVVNEDANLAKKLNQNPMSASKNFNLASTLKFSKEFYALINQLAPITFMANSLVKEEGNNVVFKITLNDGILSINDKVMK